MDKQNYTLKKETIQVLKENKLKIKRYIEKEFEKRNLIKRKRIIKSYKILVQAAYLYIIEKLSFQRLSDEMILKYNVSMSDTAWKKQLSKIAKAFYEITQQYLKQIHSQKTIEGMCTYAIDATNICIEGGKSVAYRVHTKLCIDKHTDFCTRIEDIKVGESAKLYDITPNCLYFGDRAYGRTPQMLWIHQHNAHFVFRISPSQIKLFLDKECKIRIDFHSLMTDCITSKYVYISHFNSVFKVRLICSPIPEKNHLNIEKKLKRTSYKKQNKLSKQTIEFSKYLFLVSSLPAKFSDATICNSYSSRWQIELLFKRFKSLLNLHKIRRSSLAWAKNVIFIWLAFAYIFASLSASISCICDIADFNLFSLSRALFS